MHDDRKLCLFGFETEYACSLKWKNGISVPFEHLFMDAAGKIFPHLPGVHSGIFLENGSRLYVDCGTHPELSTPECVTPRDAVKYVLAGDRIVARVAEHLATHVPVVASVWMSKCNVDHSDNHATWGCHSSFRYWHEPREMKRQLLPHLVSRVIYTGSGGWNPFSPRPQFVLSPRAFHLKGVNGTQSSDGRGIFHPRETSLAGDGSRRLHLMHGESLKSETAMFLSVGTTALILKMIEARLSPGEAVQLTNPVTVLSRFASDPTCKVRENVTSGEALAAVQIQRHYLSLAKQHMDAEFMPAWAGEVCALWENILDRLESGAPESVSTTLDWAIKYKLFEQVLRQERLGWEKLNREGAKFPPSLMERLFEVDARFSQLTGAGIFDLLDRAGMLTHRVVEEQDIVHAMSNPPPGSRAVVRGRLVKELSGRPGCYCDWSNVSDLGASRVVSLADPFCETATWEAISEKSFVTSRAPIQQTPEVLEPVAHLYRCGFYESAALMLEALSGQRAFFSYETLVRYWRFKAWVQTRRGFLDGFALLQRAPRRQEDFTFVYDHLAVARFQGLAPPRGKTLTWVGRADEIIAARAQDMQTLGSAYYEHKACFLLSVNRVQEALAALTDSDALREANEHVVARREVMRGEIHRRLGNVEEARVALRKAWRMHLVGGMDGELADYSLTMRAKLERDPTRARRWLAVAESIQESLCNNVGLTRTLLLQARLSSDRREIDTLRRRIDALRSELPALQQCSLLTNILCRWDEWTDMQLTFIAADDRFWGV